ncbi:MAG: hypothetical protein WA435_12635 [Gallionellaceae bacterium]
MNTIAALKRTAHSVTACGGFDGTLLRWTWFLPEFDAILGAGNNQNQLAN